MGLVEDEVDEVGRLCHNRVPGSRLVTCVPALVRINIRRSDTKQLTASFQFPDRYPHEPVLLELKSDRLAPPLLAGLTAVCEQQARKHIGRPHVLAVATFLRRFIDDNPLCCCSEEVSRVRQLLAAADQLKLRQKKSLVQVTLTRANYLLSVSITVPDQYPQQRPQLCVTQCSLPAALQRWLQAQADEIARVSVEPPLRPPRDAAPFQPRPSLYQMVQFLATDLTAFVAAKCPQCSEPALPEEPALCPQEGSHPRHVERVYCGHLYHLGCLVAYMKTPPFSDGKLCHTCGQRIFHDKYKVSPHLAEARWAQQQARQRELDEVVDFLS